MSLASGVILPANRFIYGFRGFHATTVFQKNLGFFYQNKFLPPSTVRFVTNQKLRLLNSAQIYRLCKWRDGFNHVAASVCAASSFNDSVGDFKDCGRVEEVKKEAANGDGSDASTGYGHGNGDSRGNRRGGGGDDGGTGSGGLGESDDWEGLRWFCWQIYKAWKYYNTLTKLSSSVVAGVGNIQAKIEGCLKEMLEPNFEGLDRLLGEILVLLLLPFALIAVAFCATLFAGILLFCLVVAALIWFWRSRRSRQP